jgi:hypothetical protein
MFILGAGLSRSKLNPFTTASPNGRCFELGAFGPKVFHIFSALLVASRPVLNPPSWYVWPPIERILLFSSL